MRKYILYELKKNLLPIVIFTVIACLIYLVAIINADFIWLAHFETSSIKVPMPTDSLVSIPIIVLCVLCTVVPVMSFSFKMNRRSADCYYSLPLRREKIFLVKTIVGITTVFVPYILCFWLGFIGTSLKDNLFNMSAFVPLFFISLPLGLALFGINSFAFTRANKILDGIIFMATYALAFAMIAFIIETKSDTNIYISNYLSSYSPIANVAEIFGDLIKKSSHYYPHEFLKWFPYVFAAVTGAASYVGLWLLTKREKAENAEQLSSSWFGYRTLIPYFIATSIAAVNLNYDLLLLVIIAAAGIIAYMLYRRSFKLTIADLASYGGALVVGICLSFI